MTFNAVTYTVDLEMTTFSGNTYTHNFGSGGLGLIDVKGAPRLTFTNEVFSNNGDAQREMTTKLVAAITTALGGNPYLGFV